MLLFHTKTDNTADKRMRVSMLMMLSYRVDVKADIDIIKPAGPTPFVP